MTIGERIKELRKVFGLTQRQLSAETQIAFQSIVNYENGRREPNSKAMAALEQYFNVTGAYLRGETDEPDEPVWETPAMKSMLNNMDEFLLQEFLPHIKNTHPESQEEIRNALAQINRILCIDNPECQRLGAMLVRIMCASAYDFMCDCAELSLEDANNRTNLSAKRGFLIGNISDTLKQISDECLLGISSSNTMPQD